MWVAGEPLRVSSGYVNEPGDSIRFGDWDISAAAGSRVSLLREGGGALSRIPVATLGVPFDMGIGLAVRRGAGGTLMLKEPALPPLKSPSLKELV
jgi:hypothetical protein